MKLALKYGLVITVAIALWVMADHMVMHISSPGSRLAVLTPIFFNLVQLVVLFLGIRAKRAESKGALTVKRGILTGLAISLVYGISACLFFLALYGILGPKLLENEPASRGNVQSATTVLLASSAGLLLGALLGGLIYSTVISFIVRSPSSGPGSPGRR